MIIVALGSNQTGNWGNPEETVRRALLELDRSGVRVLKASRLILSAPFGKTNQPAFVNGVARVATHLPPQALMQRLHMVERQAGRKRNLRWGPRTLDLDLIDYHGLVRRSTLTLPHPGVASRIFVLKPLAELEPSWRHPVLHQSAAMLLRRLDAKGEGGEL